MGCGLGFSVRHPVEVERASRAGAHSTTPGGVPSGQTLGRPRRLISKSRRRRTRVRGLQPLTVFARPIFRRCHPSLIHRIWRETTRSERTRSAL